MAEIVPENLASAKVAHKAGLRNKGIHTDREGVEVVQWLVSSGCEISMGDGIGDGIGEIIN